MDAGQDSEKCRIDKWLWAARFFKTRQLAVAALQSGKVKVDGACVKPAKVLAVGDMLTISLTPYQHAIEVLALSAKRGPAIEAQKLYQETEPSRLRRDALAAELKAAPVCAGRPDKRDRRELERFKKCL